MAGHHRAGQRVKIIAVPAEPPHSRPDDQSRIGDPAGDHHVGPGRKRLGDRESAQVGVRGQRRDAGFGERLAGVEVGQPVAVARAAPGSGGAGHRRSTWAMTGLSPARLRELRDGGGTTGWVEPAGVADDLDAAFQAGRQYLLKLGQERPGVAGPPAEHGLAEQQHGELGQPVAGEHVDRPALDHLPRGRDPVPVEPAAVGDPQNAVRAGLAPTLTGLRLRGIIAGIRRGRPARRRSTQAGSRLAAKAAMPSLASSRGEVPG